MVSDRRAGLYLGAQLGLLEQIDYNRKAVGRDRLYLALRKDPAFERLASDFARELRRFKREPAYAELQRRYAKPENLRP